jgi:hypothetical protein
MEETREATADLPDENSSLFKRDCHQAPTIRREAARRKPLPVTLQHVEARGCLEVVHHNCALARPHGQALARHVEVYSREATHGERKERKLSVKIDHQGQKVRRARLHDMSENFRRSVLDGISVRRGIGVQGLHHRFHQFWKIGMYDKRFLKEIEKKSEKINSVDEKKKGQLCG